MMTGVTNTMTRTARAIGAAVLVTAASLVPVSTAAADTPTSTLNWTACQFPNAPATLQCASIQVPVDYAHPHGPTTTVTVDRLRATGAHPVGSLFFDPGGPGSAGTEFVYAESLGRNVFSAATREHFDVIGVDPRGVGLSSPVRCDPALLNRQVSQFPTDEAGFQRLVARNRALGQSCRQLTGPLLDHVDTVSAARDLEALRQALGQGPLNYLGLSYGSQLGSTYAELFPDRIRTLALDGALDHSLSSVTSFKGEAHTYEDSLNRFFDWCAQTTSCALHGRDVGQLFDTLVAAAARQSDYGEAGLNGSTMAIECLDWPSPVRTLGDLQKLQRLGQAVAPRLGGASEFWTLFTGCVGWPSPVVNPTGPIKAVHAPPILITNATHDPETAYPWALHLHGDLPSSVLVTREGDGHTSYLAKGASRTRDAIDSYLATGRTPPPGMVYAD